MEIIWFHLIVVAICNVVVFLLLGVAFIRNYNVLTRHGESLKEAWGHIEAHLQRRYDALLSMSQVVQGYAGHEQAIDAVVAKARMLMGTGGGLGERVTKSSEAEHAISGFLGHVVHIATAFPDLKANVHFQELLNTIQETGSVITQRREHFNNMVGVYNAFFKKFPTRFYAAYLGFTEAKYFSFGEGLREEMPEMAFSQQGVVNGALAGSPKFPPDQEQPMLREPEQTEQLTDGQSQDSGQEGTSSSA